MHLLPVLSVVGALLMVLGASMLVPLAVDVAYGAATWSAFGGAALAGLAIGGALFGASRGAGEVSERDGFLVVTLGWFSGAVVGAVPLYLSGAVPTVADAMFEAMSGFTTTGASVIGDYSHLSPGVLLWRSMMQWFGGMGFIVLALVILPALGIGGMQLYKREVPGPYSEKLTPRLRDTAKALWSVYLGLTAVVVLTLWGLGMPLFEAVCHALTTVATGGYSTRPDSIAGFASPAIEWALIVFMYVAAINFTLHYRLLWSGGRRWSYRQDQEWLWFTVAIIAGALLVAADLMLTRGYAPGAALTKGSFQVVSIITSTGYASDDYMLWSSFGQMLLLAFMLTGGCAGSTAGGIKWVRVMLVFKYIHTVLLRLIHPKVVVHARIGHRRVSEDILSGILAFIFLFLTMLLVVTLLLTLDGHSLLTSLSAAASALSNIGPGLEAVGPTQTFAHFSAYAKWVMVLAMLMGRLEIMTVLVLFLPYIWRR